MEKPFSEYQDFKRQILVDEIDGVKIITIRRPQVMNATNGDMDEEILAVLEENENNPKIKGFIITGYGGQAFSAGRDIGDFPGLLGNAESSAQYTRDASKLLYFIDQMDKPIVAAVNGMALWGGLEVALRCGVTVLTAGGRQQQRLFMKCFAWEDPLKLKKPLTSAW